MARMPGILMRFRAYDDDALAWYDDDVRWRWSLDHAMQRPRLAGRTNGLVVDVMRRGTAGIEVRAEPHPGSAFAKTSDRERELCQQRQHGGSSPQKRALRVK